MCSVKRLRLAVLFLTAAALLASVPALAARRVTPNLICVLEDQNDPDYGAWGVGALGKLTYVYTYHDYFEPWLSFDIYSGELRVNCYGLSTDRAYTVVVERKLLGDVGGEWGFTVDVSGDGGIVGQIRVIGQKGKGGDRVDVYRDDGVRVLSGDVYR